MDVSKLNRDPEFIATILKEVGNELYVTEECSIHIPVRFSERGLASIGSDTYVIGIFPIICGDKYSVIMVDALMRIEPAEVNRINVNDTEYFEFVFPAGTALVANIELAQVDTLTYRIYDEIIAKARVPWYLTYFDLASLFDTAQEYAGAGIGQNKEVTELLISIIARDSASRTEYYRRVVTDTKTLTLNPPLYAPLKNVSLSATNAVSKLGGGHYRDGTISAIVSPSERVEPIEALLFQTTQNG